MVFHSVLKSEIPPPPTPPPPPLCKSLSMASTFSPAKARQPLHNFPLSDLKWSTNQSNTQRFRRPPDTHPSPSRHSDQDHHRCARKNDNRLIKLSYRSPNPSGSGNSGRDDLKTVSASEIRALNSAEISDKKLKLKKEEKLKGSQSHQTVLIRGPARNKADTDAEDDTEWADDDEEPVAKTRNLRPRRAVTKPPNANGAPLQESKPSSLTQTQPELTVTKHKVAKKKHKFSVSFSK